jgi:hypothetical protein
MTSSGQVLGVDGADLDRCAGYPQRGDTRPGHQGRFVGREFPRDGAVRRCMVDAVDDAHRPLQDVAEGRARRPPPSG